MLAGVIGIVTLAGVATDERALTRFVDVAAIKANTSIVFLLAVLALWLLAGSSTVGRRLGDVAALVTGLISLVALLEYVFEVSFGIDALSPAIRRAATSPGGCRRRRRSHSSSSLRRCSAHTAPHVRAWPRRAVRSSRRTPRSSRSSSRSRVFFGMTGVPGMSIPGALGVALGIGVFALRADALITRLLLSKSRGWPARPDRHAGGAVRGRSSSAS